MNRLQKKCFIASAAFHSLLLGILLFGSALVPAPKEEPSTVLTVVDLSSLNDNKTTGGNPNVQAAPPQAEAAPPPAAPIQPPAPTPPKQEPTRVEVPKQQEPTTPGAVAKNIEPVTHSKTAEAPTKPKTPKITLSADDTKVTKRSMTKTTKPNTSPEQDDAQTALIEARRRAGKAIASSALSLRNSMSSVTTVELPGPGGGGPLSAAYADLIRSRYMNAWSPPPGVSEGPVVIAKITIARDGTVTVGRITSPSGNAALDRSVRITLENVTFIAPFPDGTSDREKTFNLSFNLKDKLSG